MEINDFEILFDWRHVLSLTFPVYMAPKPVECELGGIGIWLLLMEGVWTMGIGITNI